MNKFNRLVVVSLAALLWALPITAYAQAGGFVRLQTAEVSGTIDSNGDSVVLLSASIGAFGAVKIQTLDSYTGTLQVQCSVDGTNYDTNNPLKVSASDASTPDTSIVDAVGTFDVQNAAGCKNIRVIATAGFADSDTVVWIRATQLGGGVGGGGSATFDGDIEVGAQPADDPHYVACSDGSAPGACVVDLSDEDKGKLDDISSNTASIAAELAGDEPIPVCDATASTFTKNTTAAQQIIAASGSNIPVICAYSVDAEGTTDWKFVSGTGSNCGTGQSDISKNHAFSTTTGYIGETHGNGVGVVVSGISGEAICLVQSATSVTNFTIRYTYIAP